MRTRSIASFYLRLQHGVCQCFPQKGGLLDALYIRRERKLRGYPRGDGTGIAGRKLPDDVGPGAGELSLRGLRGNGLREKFFFHADTDRGSEYRNARARMDEDCLTNPDRKKLHDMYWGQLTLTTADLYQEGVVEMMKNTNNIRIMLQQMNGDPVDDKDFDFEITDDNTLFACDNDLIPNGEIVYTPWARGQVSAGLMGNDKEVIMAYAEFSTSRLMLKNSPKLVIRRKADGGEVVNIPLNNYLLAFRSEFHRDMDKQEFLDRESEWSMLFFS